MDNIRHDDSSNIAYINLIIRQIKAARKAYVKAQEQEAAAFSMIENFIGDIENFPSDAENATNLQEAISCFLNYGEYDIKGIEKELHNAIPKDK